MIDVHMLLLGNENPVQLERCINSLKNEPINLILCDGIRDNLAEARKRAISLGKNDFIGWVDPDDEIIPGSYELMAKYKNHYKFIWMKEEIREFGDGNPFGNPPDKPLKVFHRNAPHHIHIVHRDLVEDKFFEKDKRTVDHWVNRFTKNGKYIDRVGYIWNSYSQSAGRQRK